MIDKHKKAIGVPESHDLTCTGSTCKQKHGWDTDTYVYEERDKAGSLLAKYEVDDSTHMYPPFENKVTFRKVKA
ncbi:hypothetical protein [Cobetia sp. 1AS1]|uniref:hypothetical protein n=1 Tax=Cobetia sp. 1AS1 TaxID=3040016 RepID=UPI00244AB37F|nr:hypothetical protein [Cobetia sp. 1AS1]MDH2293180.1 hypothetical protein [Cobetia sp. 1AS1]